MLKVIGLLLAGSFLIAGARAEAAVDGALGVLPSREQAAFEKAGYSPRLKSPRLSAEQEELHALFDLRRAVVMISREDTAGSGFFVSPTGRIVTNAHVVHADKTVKVRAWREGLHCPEGEGESGDDPLCWEGTARVLAVAPGRDLAILQVEDAYTDWRALRLAADSGSGHGDPAGGDLVYAYGDTSGKGLRVVDGIVSRQEKEADPYVKLVQARVDIFHGNSGGPLINVHGEVVGVTKGGDDLRTIAGVEVKITEMANFIPVSALRAALAEYDATARLTDVKSGVHIGEGAAIVEAGAGFSLGDVIVGVREDGAMRDLWAVEPKKREMVLKRILIKRKPGDVADVEVAAGEPARVFTGDDMKGGPILAAAANPTGLVVVSGSDAEFQAFNTASKKNNGTASVRLGNLNYKIVWIGGQVFKIDDPAWTPNPAAPRVARSLPIVEYTP